MDVIEQVTDLNRDENCNADTILTILQRYEVDLLHADAMKDMRRLEYEYLTRREIRKKERASRLTKLQELKVPMSMKYSAYPDAAKNRLATIDRSLSRNASSSLTNRQKLLKWAYDNSTMWNSSFLINTSAKKLLTDMSLKESFLKSHEDDLCACRPFL